MCSLGRKEACLREARSQGGLQVSEDRQEVRIQVQSMEVDHPSLQESLKNKNISSRMCRQCAGMVL